MASWAIEVAGRFFPEGLGNFDAHVLTEESRERQNHTLR